MNEIVALCPWFWGHWSIILTCKETLMEKWVWPINHDRVS